MAARDMSNVFRYIIQQFDWFVFNSDTDRIRCGVYYPLSNVSGEVLDAYANTKFAYREHAETIWHEYVTYKMIGLFFGVPTECINEIPYVAGTYGTVNPIVPKLYSSCKKIHFHDVDREFHELFKVDSSAAIHYINMVFQALNKYEKVALIVKSERCYNTLMHNLYVMREYIRQILLFEWYRNFIEMEAPQDLYSYDHDTFGYAAKHLMDVLEARLSILNNWNANNTKL